MKVQDVMTSNVKACRPETNLAAAATVMWEEDIGVLPVVTDEGKVVGMITDRDIAIAVGTRGCPAAGIAVSEVITGKVYSGHLHDDIHSALKTMRHWKARRLPVVNDDGLLQGILCLNDLVLRAEEKKGGRAPELSYEDAMSTMKAICEHRPLTAAAQA
ncbi:MAG TPA: CBS domain-containing protein [Blastocatellia bacterium]|nr:CBS domain-containing protein [Blastocatellia bacterium]